MPAPEVVYPAPGLCNRCRVLAPAPDKLPPAPKTQNRHQGIKPQENRASKVKAKELWFHLRRIAREACELLAANSCRMQTNCMQAGKSGKCKLRLFLSPWLLPLHPLRTSRLRLTPKCRMCRNLLTYRYMAKYVIYPTLG